MSLVQFALRRPVTVVVVVLAVLLGGALALQRMSRDIFPPLGIPTIYVAQPYGGMDPAQMEGYLTYRYEYHFLYIAGIEHVESKSIQGASIMKLQFHPGTDMSQAMSETVAQVNRSRAFMPPGTVPPFIMRFDAGSVAVGYLVFSTDDPSITLNQMQDQALNRVRPAFATLPGVSAPPPFGGSSRGVIVNVNPDRMRAYGLSPDDIVQALAGGNVISPSGNMNLGDRYPIVPVNAIVSNPRELEAVPLKRTPAGTVFVRDVATVEDGADLTTAYALAGGRRSVYLPVTKRADASTLDEVNLVKQNIPEFQKLLPEGIRVSYEFDQSPVVNRSIRDLLKEGGRGGGRNGDTGNFDDTFDFLLGASWRIGPGGIGDRARLRAADARVRQGELELEKARDTVTRQSSRRTRGCNRWATSSPWPGARSPRRRNPSSSRASGASSAWVRCWKHSRRSRS